MGPLLFSVHSSRFAAMWCSIVSRCARNWASDERQIGLRAVQQNSASAARRESLAMTASSWTRSRPSRRLSTRRALAADEWQIRRRTTRVGPQAADRTWPHCAARCSTRRHRIIRPSQALFDGPSQATATPIVERRLLAARRPSQPRPEGGQYWPGASTLLGIFALAGGVGALGWIVSGGGMQWWNHALAPRWPAKACLILGLAWSSRGFGATAAMPGQAASVHADLAQTTAHGRRHHRDARRRRAGVLCRTRPRREPADAALNLKGQIDHLATRLGGEY